MIFNIFRKNQLVIILIVLLIGGFLTTSLVSYYVALSSVRKEISSSSLPLTSDNIYSEIQRDLLRPIFISSLMANDTFLRDWVINKEKDPEKMTKYLKEIMVKYGTFTSFFVSNNTRIYYHANGILKKVKPEEPRDQWYFRVRKMKLDYEINIDPDLANKDAMTIFINHKVYDYDGRYIGATGVGLTTTCVKVLIDNYSKKYGRNIFFVDKNGKIIIHNSVYTEKHDNIKQLKGLASVADDILSTKFTRTSFINNGDKVFLNSRFIPELNWYLLVEQKEDGNIKSIHDALWINLGICGIITFVIITLTFLTVKAYQKVNETQKQEIISQKEDLAQKNEKLEQALTEVKQLTGLLPICASCKKIRDDKGYWQKLEEYFSEHTDAEFSHSICPECSSSLYPELYEEDGKTLKKRKPKP